ncbi:DUF2812 domain-containing protein [Candidatus Enterococcus clewellii]|uniref:DUF2812 domain-containing protein n=1 Tax=Candidatus Enterococcus clewellii TaxID=1834193 RepID=A0A242KBV8_9ENTE|nr:DUF2812 domain-containing protein [Enterococcus sp. 9E7_DIV0242]OTP18547.1 hypothetical protein A5888_000361 [Enterococcus sp. 9E7_DIV0242]
MGKFRLWISPRFEENFINKQAQLGRKLVQISPFSLLVPLEIHYYKFEKTKDTYLFKNDMRHFKTKEEQVEYLQLMADDGWELFKGNYTPDYWGMQSYYFFRVNTDRDNDIYSDQTTKLINNYNVASYFLMVSLIFLFLCLIFPYYQNRPISDNLLSVLLSFIFPITAFVMFIASAVTRWMIRRKLKELAVTEGEI